MRIVAVGDPRRKEQRARRQGCGRSGSSLRCKGYYDKCSQKPSEQQRIPTRLGTRELHGRDTGIGTCTGIYGLVDCLPTVDVRGDE